MPKAHKYSTKNPNPSHWGPSQKSFSRPGRSGNTYPSKFSTVSTGPTVWTEPSFTVSSSSLFPFLFLLSNFPVLEESFFAAETMWRLDFVREGGRRDNDGRWRGKRVYGVMVDVLHMIRRAIGVAGWRGFLVGGNLLSDWEDKKRDGKWVRSQPGFDPIQDNVALLFTTI